MKQEEGMKGGLTMHSLSGSYKHQKGPKRHQKGPKRTEKTRKRNEKTPKRTLILTIRIHAHD